MNCIYDLNLFNKDKELVLKLINAVLIMAFLIAFIITTNILINTLTYEKISYSEYQNSYCLYSNVQSGCNDNYDEFINDEKKQQKINLFTGLIDTFLIGGTIYMLNNNKKKKTK